MRLQRAQAAKQLDVAGRFFVRQDGTRAYYFDEVELRALFARSGFETVECAYSLRETTNRQKGVTLARRFLTAKFRKLPHGQQGALPVAMAGGASSEAGAAGVTTAGSAPTVAPGSTTMAKNAEGRDGSNTPPAATMGRVPQGLVSEEATIDASRAIAGRVSPEGWLAAKRTVRGALDTVLGGASAGVGAVGGVHAEKRRLLEELIAEMEDGEMAP